MGFGSPLQKVTFRRHNDLNFQELLMILLILAPLLVAQSTLPVTFSCAPENIQSAFAALSHITGKPIFASQVLKNDVIVINVKDMPLQTLLNNIAKVEYGRWVKESAGDYLLSDQSAIDREASKRKTDYEKKFNNYIDEMLHAEKASLSSKTPHKGFITIKQKNRGRVVYNTAFIGSPYQLEFLKACGADLFYNVPNHSTVAYSTRPNSFQYSLPSNSLAPLNKLLSNKLENNLTQVFKVDMFVTRYAYGQVQGKLVAFSRQGAALLTLDLPIMAFSLPAQLNPVLSHKSKPIRITGLVGKYLKALNHGYVPLNADQLNLLRNTAQFDPLIGTVGPLGTCTRAIGDNLVASLPDTLLNSNAIQTTQLNSMTSMYQKHHATPSSLLTPTLQPQATTIVPSDYLTSLIASHSIHVTLKNGTMLVAMTSPDTCRQLRLNRTKLRQALLKIGPVSVARLANIAKVYYACNGQVPSGVNSIINAINFENQGALQFADPYWLAFFGSLNKTLQNSLESGQSITCRALDSNEINCLTLALENGMGSHGYSFPPTEGVNFQKFMDKYQRTHAYQSYFSEAFPNGLPESLKLSCDVSKDKFYQPVPDTSDPQQFRVQSYPVAYNSYTDAKGLEHDTITRREYFIGPDFSRCLVHTSLQLSLSVSLSPTSSIVATLLDIVSSPNDPIIKTPLVLPVGQPYLFPIGTLVTQKNGFVQLNGITTSVGVPTTNSSYSTQP